MRGLLTTIVIGLALLFGLIVYDANKTFTSSWAARGYFYFYRDTLTRFAEEFQRDENIRGAGYFVDGSIGATFEDYADVDKAIQEKADAKYAELLRALYPNPFLIFCNGWFKKAGDAGSFCVGMRDYVPMLPRGLDQPTYHFSYWPQGVALEQPCHVSTPREHYGWCEIVLDDSWSIQYEWLRLDDQ